MVGFGITVIHKRHPTDPRSCVVIRLQTRHTVRAEVEAFRPLERLGNAQAPAACLGPQPEFRDFLLERRFRLR